MTAAELVTEFHNHYDYPVRTTPSLDVPERVLRAELIREEFIDEFLPALGLRLSADGTSIEEDPDGTLDLVEAADALADMKYVIEGGALTFGIPLSPIFEHVHASNMSKLGADGKPMYREGDRKLLKGPNYWDPKDGIRAILIEAAQ